MFTKLDPRSPVPLYDQIASRIRMGVASGEIRPDQALPSVRHLAGRLRVNPATVVQAYRELEAGGFVEMRQGAGTFVKEIARDKRSRERKKQASELVREMLQRAAGLGIDAQEVETALSRELALE